MKTLRILHRGSLMTYPDNGRERCFGYLFSFLGHGIFEPTFGKLEVSLADATTHNQLLPWAATLTNKQSTLNIQPTNKGGDTSNGEGGL